MLDVPLAGTIAVVTFICVYVPYIGAFVAGAFAVLLANGLLQIILQPFVMGSALELHPLVVLVVTIAAGCILGMLGLMLAAPLTSAAVHASRDLGRARAAANDDPVS